MMKECWNHAAKSRPTALKLKQKLNDIVTAFRNLEIRERPLTDMYSTLYQRWNHVDFGLRRLFTINNVKTVNKNTLTRGKLILNVNMIIWEMSNNNFVLIYNFFIRFGFVRNNQLNRWWDMQKDSIHYWFKTRM